MINEAILMKAVRDLRERLRLTQVEIAVKLGLSPATIFRYETVRPPKPQAIGPFLKLAEESGHLDLAALFRESLAAIAPSEFSSEERRYVDALVAVLRDPKAKGRRNIIGFLEKYITENLPAVGGGERQRGDRQRG